MVPETSVHENYVIQIGLKLDYKLRTKLKSIPWPQKPHWTLVDANKHWTSLKGNKPIMDRLTPATGYSSYPNLCSVHLR